MTILYPTDSSVVAPMPYKRLVGRFTSIEAQVACKNNVGDEYRLPTKDEAAALFAFTPFMGIIDDSYAAGHLYTSSKIARNDGSIVNGVIVTQFGHFRKPLVDGSWSTLCVKR